MNNTAAELIQLWKTYKGEEEALLEGEKKLEYLYALSKARENLLDWFPFENGRRLLQVGADCGALTGMFLEKGLEVTILDPEEAESEFIRKRYKSEEQNSRMTFFRGSLTDDAEIVKEEKGRFDYIAIIGSLEADSERLHRQIKNGKKLLVPGGFLFLAADNPAGLKHWAGAPKEENAIGKRRLIKLLEKGKKGAKGKTTVYYPFPDYKLPSEIYSDQWLPEKGDLSGTVISYDYPEFLKANIGASYDMICGEGQFKEFSNSYLIVWKKESRTL